MNHNKHHFAVKAGGPGSGSWESPGCPRFSFTPAAQKVWNEAKAKKSEFEAVDTSHLSKEERRSLAAAGLSFTEDRLGRPIAAYPARLRQDDIRDAVANKRKTRNPDISAAGPSANLSVLFAALTRPDAKVSAPASLQAALRAVDEELAARQTARLAVKAGGIGSGSWFGPGRPKFDWKREAEDPTNDPPGEPRGRIRNAVLIIGNKRWRGKTHAAALAKHLKETGRTEVPDNEDWKEGFETDSGHYLNRNQAAKVFYDTDHKSAMKLWTEDMALAARDDGELELVVTASKATSPKYGCLMAMIPALQQATSKWSDKLAEGSLAEDGVETEPHVTVLYGFALGFDTSRLARFLKDNGSAKLVLGSISRFECPDYDVLKVDVESPALERLHGELAEEFNAEVTPSKHAYHPHLTLAYIQKGTNKELDGDDSFDGLTFTVSQLLYSLPDKQGRTFVDLGFAKNASNIVTEEEPVNFASKPNDMVASTKVLIKDANGKILLLDDAGSGFWDLPGGHLESGETPAEAVQREVREETGLELTNLRQVNGDVLSLGGRKTPVFFFESELANSSPRIQISHEHVGYRWVTPKQALELNAGAFDPFISKRLSGEHAALKRADALRDRAANYYRTAFHRVLERAKTETLQNLAGTISASEPGKATFSQEKPRLHDARQQGEDAKAVVLAGGSGSGSWNGPGQPRFAWAKQQTDSPEFKAWFGNSKVANEDGSPKVMYHATHVWKKEDGRSLGDFSEFDRLGAIKALNRSPGMDAVGSWFSSKPSKDGAGMYGGDAIYPVYLSIKNPYTTTFKQFLATGQRLDNWKPKTTFKYTDKVTGEKRSFTETTPQGRWNPEKFRNDLISRGYDGLHFLASEKIDGGTHEVFVAFHPTQIKSVFNRGTWDKTNPNISASDPFVQAAVPVASDFLFNLTNFQADFLQQMRTAGESAFNVCARGILKDMGFGDTFGDLKITEQGLVEDFLIKRENLIKNIPQDIYDHITARIEGSAMAGGSIKDIAEEIEDLFEQTYDRRAETVARTESASAYGVANDAAIKQAGFTHKRWLSAEDEFVRPSHAALDGTIIGVDETFDNGCKFPGDPDGEAKEVINCRCCLVAVSAEEAAGAEKDEEGMLTAADPGAQLGHPFYCNQWMLTSQSKTDEHIKKSRDTSLPMPLRIAHIKSANAYSPHRKLSRHERRTAHREAADAHFEADRSSPHFKEHEDALVDDFNNVQASEWREELHPRADDGKFGVKNNVKHASAIESFSDQEHSRDNDGKFAAKSTLYHVTRTKNLKSIVKKGLKSFQTSNWADAAGNRLGDGAVHVFENRDDAVKWGGKMDWSENRATGTGDVSVVEIKPDDGLWAIDHNDPLSQMSLGGGKWLKRFAPVKPSHVERHWPITEEIIADTIKRDRERYKVVEGSEPFDQDKHPRQPKGSEHGGEFVTKDSHQLRRYAETPEGKSFLENPLKRLLDDLRKESKDGQLIIGDPSDGRMMIVAIAGGEPLRKASKFLGGEIKLPEADNVPDWARKLATGGHHTGACYDEAGRFGLRAVELPSELKKQVTVVHGAIGNKETTAMLGHGWVEIGDNFVFDGVTQKFYEKSVYYQELGALSEQRYPVTGLAAVVCKKKFWGPWGPTLGITKLGSKPKRRRK